MNASNTFINSLTHIEQRIDDNDNHAFAARCWLLGILPASVVLYRIDPVLSLILCIVAICLLWTRESLAHIRETRWYRFYIQKKVARTGSEFPTNAPRVRRMCATMFRSWDVTPVYVGSFVILALVALCSLPKQGRQIDKECFLARRSARMEIFHARIETVKIAMKKITMQVFDSERRRNQTGTK